MRKAYGTVAMEAEMVRRLNSSSRGALALRLMLAKLRRDQNGRNGRRARGTPAWLTSSTRRIEALQLMACSNSSRGGCEQARSRLCIRRPAKGSVQSTQQAELAQQPKSSPLALPPSCTSPSSTLPTPLEGLAVCSGRPLTYARGKQQPRRLGYPEARAKKTIPTAWNPAWLLVPAHA